MKPSPRDVAAIVALMVCTGLFALFVVDFSLPPFEDAAMLMRYADHFAQGHGIVWNIGEPPVDGATDFLFMIWVGLLRWLGLGIENAVLFLTVPAHFATVGLVYWGMRSVQKAGIVPAFVSALYFATGPGLFITAAYFGTPVYAFVMAVAWLLAQRLLQPGGDTRGVRVAFSLACLTFSLVRPEGVLVSAFMLAALGLMMPRAAFWRLGVIFAGAFLLIGGAYFLWRWQYFGHPLPNPFYKKGGGQLYWGSLTASLSNTISMGWPFFPAFLLAVRSGETMKRCAAFLTPILGGTFMFVLLSGEMNFGNRFQYPMLALFALSWYPLAGGLAGELRLPSFASLAARQKVALALAGAAVLCFVFQRQITNSRKHFYYPTGLYDVATLLNKYAGRGYTIATTEAGLLPLYSGWRAIDTWGLNDSWIAHNGGITLEYLAAQKPDVIVWHEFFSPLFPPPPTAPDGAGIRPAAWFDMVMVMKQYAEQNNFTLAAVFGTHPRDTHYYYVRSDLPHRDEIVAGIRATPYPSSNNGRLCVNYALPGAQ